MPDTARVIPYLLNFYLNRKFKGYSENKTDSL